MTTKGKMADRKRKRKWNLEIQYKTEYIIK